MLYWHAEGFISKRLRVILFVLECLQRSFYQNAYKEFVSEHLPGILIGSDFALKRLQGILC